MCACMFVSCNYISDCGRFVGGQFAGYCVAKIVTTPKLSPKKNHKTQLKPPPWWKPVLLRLLLQHLKSKYNNDTAIEYTITHALSTGILGMSNTTTHSDISCVMSVWVIFHPLGHPHDSSCSYYINIVIYTQDITCTALSYHNNGRRFVRYTLFIIPALSTPTTYAVDVGLSYIQPSNTTSVIQSRHDDRISLWNDA